MPIYDYECYECKQVFELMFIVVDKPGEKCPYCESSKIKRLFSVPHIRISSDSILKSMPDPVPPLQELIDKNRPGTTGGFQELKNEQRQLKEYNRVKDKNGNSIWLPKKKVHIDMGRKN